ncbi:transposable element tc3 transposase, putative [Perkinsus marinus ATCC 50983]|uniref:Transposable element tc3 transposase, putative n=1 Tax=Perkinsus marinus (strain ATCC 50983 / TXsc) TaxID=423536 RepID=C5KAA5_PERM5|nr:transposable element tc3 transposase, putative [Perkinsus marinus ATCC 50983]EER18566.1 transposable element tc3 transposase, putative [Perkinsus marinus ATCC 50983]|eukprot:XP_002786770.1 transposable element tc3 transposase, putative [Perkinsus marinus ATCC 50983]
MARSPLATSKEIFEGAGVTMKPKTSRLKEAIAKPALTARHKKTRYEWAENNTKREFSSVPFTDECRASFDGPDGLVLPARKKKQQGGGGVMFSAGIIGDTVVGPCRVEKGVKMDSKAEVYRQGTHYDSVDRLWSVIEDAAKKIAPEEVKKLTCSMDKRLKKLLQLHGGA